MEKKHFVLVNQEDRFPRVAELLEDGSLKSLYLTSRDNKEFTATLEETHIFVHGEDNPDQKKDYYEVAYKCELEVFSF